MTLNRWTCTSNDRFSPALRVRGGILDDSNRCTADIERRSSSGCNGSTQACRGTLHHLIELYEHLIPGNPATVFESIYQVLLGRGREEGYHFESLGNTAVVRIVQRYVADHRVIFEDEGRRARLVEILCLFSEGGWAEALKLLYELPELLR
ncbi:hypothetical protein YS110_08680 [Acidovorax sp. YS12]|nr:hypothetical protein YS110_08680 [Acidovorax sp. YS12]